MSTISAEDAKILRELALQFRDVAELPVQKEKVALWKQLNSLERTRPLILLRNSAWHEVGDEIRNECKGEFAQKQESGLRLPLYQWQHLKDDLVHQPVIVSPIVVDCTDTGIDVDASIPEQVFGAKQFHCVLEDDADPNMISMPEVTVNWEETESNYQCLCEVYDGIMPVEKRGPNRFWFGIMDHFIMWRGIDNMFIDIVDRPEWVHSWMNRMTEWELSRLDQLEKLGVLSRNDCETVVGSGGLGFTDELPQSDFDGEHVRQKDLWGHSSTQIFSLVSPEMHEEFALTYERRFLERFGVTGYGCCEPLHHKVDIVRNAFPNIRRISMSPWVDIECGAEALGSDIIFSYKPNPAVLCMDNWNRDLAMSQLRDVLEKTRGCVVEVIMKDLHTCRNEPYRMQEWVDMAMQLAREYE